jgi:cytochrome c-type biogenesis protein CcmF
VVSLVTALLLPFTLDHWSPMVSFGLLLAFWIMTSGLVTLLDRIKNTATGSGAWARLRNTPRSYYGMLLAHFGVAVFVIGVTMVKGYDVEKDMRMAAGDTAEIGGYTFELLGVAKVPGPNYVASRATVRVTRGGRSVTTLHPEKRIYNVQQSPMTEAAIDAGFTRDLYVSLGDELGPNTWLVRIQHKPFVDWIWGGCLLMALGGFLAATDRRYRVASRQRKEDYAAAPRPQANPAR